MTNPATQAIEPEQGTDLPTARKATWTKVALVVVAVVGVQSAAFALVVALLDGWAKRGQFGDIFGVTNSLFSGLAFAGLIYTIYLQEQQIAFQARESRRGDAAARETLRLSAEAVRLTQEQLQLARAREARDVSVMLLEHYEGELARLDALGAEGLGPANIDIQKVRLTTKVVKLRAVVDTAYDQSTK